MQLPIRCRDISGQKFNKLTVVAFSHIGSNGYSFWKFKCDCGKSIRFNASRVWRGLKKSCGCSWAEAQSIAQTKHGCKYKRIYRIWHGMKSRCTNAKHHAYDRYGGRGVKICRRWLTFTNFYKDMGEPLSNEHTLDRINNSKGYSKNNCRWATKVEQNRNSRGNASYTFKGKTQCIAAWADEYGLRRSILYDRLRRTPGKWSIEQALTTPVQKNKSRC